MMINLANCRILVALTVAAIAAAGASLASGTQSSARSTACTAPAELTHFDRPLNRIGRLLMNEKPITIVAIGSSSTAGAGASSTAATYPSRLEVELKERFPLRGVKVLNRGVNGAEVGDILARFNESMPADKPDLVIWQVGTNSLLRDRPLSEAGDRINKGLSKIKVMGADAILINPQFAPRVIVKPELDHMLKIISKTAKQANINLFDRFAVMRNWRVAQNLPFSEFLSVDELHMNDWSYGCVAKLLASAIKEAATRPAYTATTAPARPAR